MQQLHAFISGQVQGVSFRYFAQRKAIQLQLSGWVRNLPDGRVETVAEGAQEPLQAYARFLHTGPPAAVVTSVDLEWKAAGGDIKGFEVRWR